MRTHEDLRPSQHDIADAIYENDQSLIEAPMGAGKTGGALSSFVELQRDGIVRRMLVVAPPLVAASVWTEEPRKWEHLEHLVVEPLTGGPAERLRQLKESTADILTLSCHLCTWLEKNASEIPEDLDMLLIDETSFFKDPRSKHGKALRKIAGRFPLRHGLTGTSRPNGYEDLWGQMQILTDSAMFEPFDEWRRRNFMALDPQGYRWEIHSFTAKKIDRKLAPYVHVINVDLDLEPLNAGEEWDRVIDLPPEARERYDEMEKDLITRVLANLDEQPDEAELEALLIAALSEGVASGKLSQIAQGYIYDEGKAASRLHTAKADALSELHRSIGAEPTLIWYGFHEDVSLIRGVAGGSTPVIGGGVPPTRKQKYLDAFRAGEIERLIMHPASAAHGIDGLQKAGRRHIWFCPTWSAEQYNQALARLHRPGQTRPVFSHRIVARDTVDEIKINRVEGKTEAAASWRRLLEQLKEKCS